MTILSIVFTLVVFGAGYYVHRRWGSVIEGRLPSWLK